MADAQKPKSKYHPLATLGLLLSVVCASLWGGIALIRAIEHLLPFGLGIGIVLLLLGIYLQVQNRGSELREPDDNP